MVDVRRVAIAARVFTLAVIISTTVVGDVGLGGVWFVLVIAAVAEALSMTRALPEGPIVAIEGALTAAAAAATQRVRLLRVGGRPAGTVGASGPGPAGFVLAMMVVAAARSPPDKASTARRANSPVLAGRSAGLRASPRWITGSSRAGTDPASSGGAPSRWDRRMTSAEPENTGRPVRHSARTQASE